jgi:MYND finger
MSTEMCSVSLCTKPGKLLCTGCTRPQSRYCSKECQKSDWKSHKLSCAGAQKSNCFLIRASASSSRPDEPTSADYIEPLNLEKYGDETDERVELKEKLGWEGVTQVGKFYSHDGADTWYYFAYGPHISPASSSPKNEVASLCIGQRIVGDVAVIRSGPVDSNDYSTSFSKMELVRTAEYYRTANPRVVFVEREEARAMRKWGFSSRPP